MEKLTTEELKALCEYFYKEGSKRETPFEETFNILMQGKYDAAIKQRGIELQWYEMMREIENNMEDFDREQKLKAAQAIQDLSKIIITC